MGSSPTSGIMRQKIVVILGPTASGKSGLAVKLAKKFNGEVISADSRQVYRGLDIGTGKITRREMQGVRHHLLDVADPRKQYSVVRYIKQAREAIADIMRRGKLPIVCGGTGFYTSALLGDETIPDVPPNKALRKKLQTKTASELYALLKKLNPKRARIMNKSDRANHRRLIRAIEIAKDYRHKNTHTLNLCGRTSLVYGCNILKIGILLPKKELRRRITIRLFARIRVGMVAEAKRLHAPPAGGGLSWKRMEELGLEYRYLALFLQKRITREEMLQRLDTEIWHYARRQMTWFKRDKEIVWAAKSDIQELTPRIKTFLK